MANKNRREQNGDILKARDEMLCGIHVGGCGTRVATNEISLDHIIPQSFQKNQPENKIANLQIMCKRCNNVKKGGQLRGLPVFNCTCHYFQIEGENLVLVYEDMRTEYAIYNVRHMIMNNIVNRTDDDRHAFRLVSGARHEGKRVAGKKYMGWSAITGFEFGHVINGIHYDEVESFNTAQRERCPVAILGDKKFHLTELRGRVYQVLDASELQEGSRIFDTASVPSAEINEIVNRRLFHDG